MHQAAGYNTREAARGRDLLAQDPNNILGSVLFQIDS